MLREKAALLLRGRPADDSGQGTVAVIGLLILSLAIVGLAVDTTRLIIVRRDLQSAADAAALAGASQIDGRTFRSSGGTLLKLDPQAAHASAFRTFALQAPAGSSESPTATRDWVAVVAWARVQFTFLPLVGFDSAEIQAVGRAQPVVPGAR